MQRINVLLQKLTSLQEREGVKTVLDADLMLDYLRVLYADVLEWRDSLAAKQALPALREPTLDELTEAYAGADDPENGLETPQQFLKPKPVATAPKMPESHKKPAEPVSPKKPEAAPQKDFQRVVGINDRILFMNELFGGSQEKYNQMAAAMNVSPTYDHAREWLALQAGIREDEEDITRELFFGLVRRFFRDHSK